MNLDKIEQRLSKMFQRVDDIALFNQEKVLNAFKECSISVRHFAGTTGYGYDDVGRDTLRKLYSVVFKSEDAIVSPLLTCGSHAISTALFGLLRTGDTMLSITGKPYDTLDDTIWGTGNGSLKEYGISYKQIDLNNDGLINLEECEREAAKLKPKLIFFQRSRGYNWRKPICCEEIQKAIKVLKKVSPNSFFVVDNCYGEFVEKIEPTEVGADVAVGSLIKNPGGGMAANGGYIVGTSKAIEQISYRLTSPSLGLEVGSFEGGYRLFYQGLFMAPHIVAQAVKGAYLLGAVMKEKGYKILPENDEPSYDIIKSIEFNTEQELISFVQLVQKFSPIDSFVVPMPWDMPGYSDKVIMAAGTFVDGASIELSCDSPIRSPYVAYFQGGLTYEHIKILALYLSENF